ncbi:hypothetical protein JG687_00001405 [Phytophthora cactorum]|uniref:Uncharacterized protein n=1 Tax=Phytophthora cactorum TaxID=29920 RepID=A0A8T1UY47_9STRA|nr:hypothetical protein GQ600_7921 [Phytophthora cactorum]KAG6972573.1 hypothetical protein JG687_00001405 [Phytophthora cactorum]
MLARGKRLNSVRKAMHESYPHLADKWNSEETVIWLSLPATPAQSCCGSVRLWNSTDIKIFYAPSEYKEKRRRSFKTYAVQHNPALHLEWAYKLDGDPPERDGLERLLCEEYGVMLVRISTTYTYKDPVSMKTFICSRLSELQSSEASASHRYALSLA